MEGPKTQEPVEFVPGGPRANLLWANIVILCFLSLQLGCILADTEWWPFSNVPMFSGLTPDRFSVVELHGVTGSREFPLDVPRQLSPFGEIALRFAIRDFAKTPEELTRMLRALGEVYERGRRIRRSDDPPLDQIKLYDVVHAVRPGVYIESSRTLRQTVDLPAVSR